MRFQKKPLESSSLSANYKRNSLNTFMAWMHPMSAGEEALKMALNRTYGDPIFNSAIAKWVAKECEKKIARYTPTKTLLVDHREKPENLKKGCYEALLDMWVG